MHHVKACMRLLWFFHSQKVESFHWRTFFSDWVGTIVLPKLSQLSFQFHQFQLAEKSHLVADEMRAIRHSSCLPFNQFTIVSLIQIYGWFGSNFFTSSWLELEGYSIVFLKLEKYWNCMNHKFFDHSELYHSLGTQGLNVERSNKTSLN